MCLLNDTTYKKKEGGKVSLEGDNIYLSLLTSDNPQKAGLRTGNVSYTHMHVCRHTCIVGAGKGPEGSPPSLSMLHCPRLPGEPDTRGSGAQTSRGLGFVASQDPQAAQSQPASALPTLSLEGLAHTQSSRNLSYPKVAGPPEERHRDADTSSPAFTPRLQLWQLEVGEEVQKILSSAE